MTPFGSSRGRSAALLVSVCAALASSSVHASIHGWQYEPGAAGVTADSTGGTIAGIDAQYNSEARRLDWSVDFSDRVTEGFALVVSDGALPNARRGQYAMIYFDAAGVVNGQTLTPKVTAYAYNGRGVPDSWFDGDGDPNNNGVHEPRPDCIKTLFDASWVLSATAQDVLLDDGSMGRRFSLSFSANDLINHSPEFPGSGGAWSGTGFTQSLGLWMFTSQIFDVEYAANGEIASLGTELRGSLEGNALRTFDIPAPGAAVIAGAGLLMLARRRR